MNYNKEIRSFVNANKNRTEQDFFEKLKNNFGTDIGPKIAFYVIYEKQYFFVFLSHNLLDRDSPSSWTQNWKLVTEMGKVSMLHLLEKVRPSFFQTSKFRCFLTFLQNFFTQKRNILNYSPKKGIYFFKTIQS